MKTFQMPTQSGVILLPRAVLFPQGVLPLRIFEPRYRQMLAEALEGERVFCVGNLHSAEEEPFAQCVHPVGTIALIQTSREQADGSSQVLLRGLSRVRFDHWLNHSPYPLARFTEGPSASLPDEEDAEILMDELEALVEQTLLDGPDEIRFAVKAILDPVRHHPELFGDLIAQHLITHPDLRQTLLAEPDLAKRFELMANQLAHDLP
ncbi:LON peptidase substrate-binding domain-containing protein [Roseibacillus ishigakijimensis]|uniref:LON peptidase substrate-binding domain-containing protein n=1 Tax=Roseibacillus ishigakijimensis TaxID=454146 RepID=A0A934RS93_9BACT|nr:LON peptidase substrate-binding domain-containing protein [Roseibacillus ishigakijimensis]MBK1834084.1 LON peptidase substrate-binding domain-containing protein [Roseibacillus ishigakijimensis]